ncbi:multidrug resistance protein [Phaffia rhodozyma]|uniref:Multidrug resistance protein n=1 Tax=Phaffia rhodozyma TaxID=264483 RepID=A0A0F7SM09_PHARH|nr:multidrug resistance protein [Phaffia rhodozyma]
MTFTAFQTTALGAAIRVLSGRRLLKYSDEKEVPDHWLHPNENRPRFITALRPKVTVHMPRASQESDMTRVDPEAASHHNNKAGKGKEEKGKDGNIVDFDGPDDPENPLNWSTWYKCFVCFQISLLTFSVYIGSSIYSPALIGTNSVASTFDVSQTSALVGLTLFVIGYAISPMIWSPMSEIPRIGRNPIYIGTLVIFVAIQFPTIYAKNIHVLLAMRFLAGFFGAPVLATGGASVSDLFAPKYRAYPLAVWGLGAVSGPTLGPLLGGFAFQANGWSWTIWVLLWLSGGALIFLSIFLPETSPDNILYRKAVRLRRATGNDALQSQGEIDLQGSSVGAMVKDTLVKPFVLGTEPIVFALNLYIALVYGILYIWFESFPLVFTELHMFNSGESGLAFLGIFVGAVIGLIGYVVYSKLKFEPEFEKNGNGMIKPELRIPVMCVGGFCLPICLFMFGWTGHSASIHWILPIIGSSFFGIGSLLLFQSIFSYLTDAYPKDVASILAGNDLMRGAFGAGFPLFANAMFHHLGIGGASSLLGGLTCCFVAIPFVLLKFGSKLRHSSKHALKDEDIEA